MTLLEAVRNVPHDVGCASVVTERGYDVVDLRPDCRIAGNMSGRVVTKDRVTGAIIPIMCGCGGSMFLCSTHAEEFLRGPIALACDCDRDERIAKGIEAALTEAWNGGHDDLELHYKDVERNIIAAFIRGSAVQ